MGTTLHVSLLGGFQVLADGQPVGGLEPPRLQSLLGRLVLNAGEPQPRRQLAYLYWPDSTEQQARTNLRQVIHQLRFALPDHAEFVASERGALTWRIEARYTLDVAMFQHAARDASTTRALAEAVSLYRGDLLPGIYDEWLVPERERLRTAFTNVLEEAIADAVSRVDYRSAIALIQRLIEHDALHEEAYRYLMQLSSLRGDRSGVSRAYHACRVIWERELGVAPSPETSALYERLQADAIRPGPPMPLSRMSRRLGPAGSNDPYSMAATRQRSPASLPASPTPLIGREVEQASIRDLIEREAARIVTITGPGGIGKTRLAAAVAGVVQAGFSDGMWFVDLAATSDAAGVGSAIATALNAPERHGEPIGETIGDFLRHRHALLVLDNFEQVIEAAVLVAELVSAAPAVTVLITSRAPLRLLGEHEFPVEGLPVPSDPDIAMSSDQPCRSPAVRLFTERARSIQPHFECTQSTGPDIARICRALDGIPLAIELAAARVRLLPLESLVSGLTNRLDLLVSGPRDAPERQRTLRNAIDWSYRLLSPSEQVLFARSAVFARGATLEAMTAVCDLPSSDGSTPDSVLRDIESLVLQSMLQPMGDEHARASGRNLRFGMFETIREYALERLAERDERELLHRRHAEYFASLVERAELALVTGSDPSQRIAAIAADEDNLLAGLTWSIGGGDPELGLRLAAACGMYWFIRGHSETGRHWLTRALDAAQPAAPAYRARILNNLGGFAIQQGDHASALPLLEISLDLFRELGDELWTAWTLFRLGQATRYSGNWQLAIERFEESLTLSAGQDDVYGLVRGLPLVHLGLLLMEHSDSQQGITLLQEALDLGRSIGNRTVIGVALVGLAWVAHYRGEDDLAIARAEDALALLRSVGHYLGTAEALVALGWIVLADDEPERARQVFRECLVLAHERGGRSHVADALAGLAAVAARRASDPHASEGAEQAQCAARLFAASERLRETAGPPFYPSGMAVRRSRDDAHTRFDGTVWARASDVGVAMSIDDAVSYALGDS